MWLVSLLPVIPSKWPNYKKELHLAISTTQQFIPSLKYICTKFNIHDLITFTVHPLNLYISTYLLVLLVFRSVLLKGYNTYIILSIVCTQYIDILEVEQVHHICVVFRAPSVTWAPFLPYQRRSVPVHHRSHHQALKRQLQIRKSESVLRVDRMSHHPGPGQCLLNVSHESGECVC